MDIKLISTIAAALAVSIGSLGPAPGGGPLSRRGDGRHRPATGVGRYHLTPPLCRSRDDRDDGDLLPSGGPDTALCQSLCWVTMHFDWSTLALQTANFAILVWLLHRFLYRQVLRMVVARRAEIEKQYDAAGTAEAQTKDRLAEVEAQRAGIAAERAAALKDAMAQVEQAASERRAQAEREAAAALLEDARKTLAAERRQALAETQRAAL